MQSVKIENNNFKAIFMKVFWQFNKLNDKLYN